MAVLQPVAQCRQRATYALAQHVLSGRHTRLEEGSPTRRQGPMVPD